MFAKVFNTDEVVVLKANPYHGAGGRFSTKEQASFVSTGGVFARSNARDKEGWDAQSRSTTPKDRAKGASQVKSVLEGDQFGWNGKMSGTTVKAKGDKLTIKEPIYSSEKKVVDRARENSQKDWSSNGTYAKYFSEDHGVEVNYSGSRITGDGTYGKRSKNGRDIPPYYLETDVSVISTKKKKTARKNSGWSVDLGLIS